MQNVRLFLVRHGLSEANLNLEMNRRKPDHSIELDVKGHEQAYKNGLFMGKYLRTSHENGRHINLRFLVSPYLRTRQTAAGIQKGLGEAFPDLEWSQKEALALREQGFGQFDGLRNDELESIYPKEYAYYQKHSDWEGEFFAPMPLGESRCQVADRVRSTFGTILRSASYEREDPVTDFIIVSHGVTIRTFRMEWLHLPWEWCETEPNPNNCSTSLIEGRPGKGWTDNRIFAGFHHVKDAQEVRESGHVNPDDKE